MFEAMAKLMMEQLTKQGIDPVELAKQFKEGVDAFKSMDERLKRIEALQADIITLVGPSPPDTVQ